MDDMNIHIEEVVLDGTFPPSPEQVQEALSRQADNAQIPHLPAVARVIGESLRTRLAGESR